MAQVDLAVRGIGLLVLGNFMASAGKELAVQIVGNSLGSFIFGSYTFVSDLIYDRFRRQ